MPVILTTHPLVEDALAPFASALGAARAAYTGHVYRVFNVARALEPSPSHGDALAAASAFHDLGIWSDRTFDYLEPSVDRARAYLEQRRPELRSDLVASLLREHHRLRAFREGMDASAVEAFRRADLVDVSRGLLGGVDSAFFRELVRAFPYEGFHGVLVRTAAAWFVRHPLRPLPMIRLG